jgi:hypothetical protein
MAVMVYLAEPWQQLAVEKIEKASALIPPLEFQAADGKLRRKQSGKSALREVDAEGRTFYGKYQMILLPCAGFPTKAI